MKNEWVTGKMTKRRREIEGAWTVCGMLNFSSYLYQILFYLLPLFFCHVRNRKKKRGRFKEEMACNKSLVNQSYSFHDKSPERTLCFSHLKQGGKKLSVRRWVITISSCLFSVLIEFEKKYKITFYGKKCDWIMVGGQSYRHDFVVAKIWNKDMIVTYSLPFPVDVCKRKQLCGANKRVEYVVTPSRAEKKNLSKKERSTLHVSKKKWNVCSSETYVELERSNWGSKPTR